MIVSDWPTTVPVTAVEATAAELLPAMTPDSWRPVAGYIAWSILAGIAIVLHTSSYVDPAATLIVARNDDVWLVFQVFG